MSDRRKPKGSRALIRDSFGRFVSSENQAWREREIKQRKAEKVQAAQEARERYQKQVKALQKAKTKRSTDPKTGKLRPSYRPKQQDLTSTLKALRKGVIPKPASATKLGNFVITRWRFFGAESVEVAESTLLRLSERFGKTAGIFGRTAIGTRYGKGGDWVGSANTSIMEQWSYLQRAQYRQSAQKVFEEIEQGESIWSDIELAIPAFRYKGGFQSRGKQSSGKRRVALQKGKGAKRSTNAKTGSKGRKGKR